MTTVAWATFALARINSYKRADSRVLSYAFLPLLFRVGGSYLISGHGILVAATLEFIVLLTAKNRLARPVICLFQMPRHRPESKVRFVGLLIGDLLNRVDIIQESCFGREVQQAGFDHFLEELAFATDKFRIWW